MVRCPTLTTPNMERSNMASTALSQKSEDVLPLLEIAEICERGCCDEFLIEKDIALQVFPEARAIANDDYRITIRQDGKRTYVRVPGYLCDIRAALQLVPDGFYPTIDFVTKRCWVRDEKGRDVPGGVAYGFGNDITGSISAAACRAHAFLKAAA